MPRDSSPGSDRSFPDQLQLLDERARAPVEIVDLVQPRDESEMLFDRQVLEQVRFVGHERQAALGGDGIGDHVVTVHDDVSGRRAQDARQGPQRRRLAGAVGADQADDFPPPSSNERLSTAVNVDPAGPAYVRVSCWTARGTVVPMLR